MRFHETRQASEWLNVIIQVDATVGGTDAAFGETAVASTITRPAPPLLVTRDARSANRLESRSRTSTDTSATRPRGCGAEHLSGDNFRRVEPCLLFGLRKE